jgi:hypothetical protein
MGRDGDAATDALRSGSIDSLIGRLKEILAVHQGFGDYRDVMLSLAPFFDAAQRLGANPVDVFDRAADGQQEDVAELARRFGRRTDVTLQVFSWRLQDDADGPRYVFDWSIAWPRRRSGSSNTEA